MAEKAQNFENHVKFVPQFHFFVVPVLLVNVIWSIVRLVHSVSAWTAFEVLVAFALLLLAFVSRVTALTVQDRLIRLEMRLRLLEMLPADLKPRIGDFTVGQLVSLRFASDAELPELARKVLADNVTDRKAIKKMVRNWQGDFLRA
jgi:hypothetical protein